MLELSLNLDVNCKKLKTFIRKISNRFGKESLFIKNYNNFKFFKKIKALYNLRIFILRGEIVGYIWYEPSGENIFTIKEIFYDEIIYEFDLTETAAKFFKKRLFIYECNENFINSKIMTKFGFSLRYETYLMKLTIERQNNISLAENYYFSTLVKDEEESVRCSIQNEAFKDDTRIPLTLEDIYFDESQDYYIEKFCIFLRHNFEYIGYAQIIYTDNKYTIVNVGIKDSYKGNGFGRLLLMKLINLAYENNIKELYIKVKKENYIARKLYSSLNFKYIETIQTWESL